MLFPFFVIWAISHIRQVNFSITIVILANHAVIGLLVQTTSALKAIISKKWTACPFRQTIRLLIYGKTFSIRWGLKNEKIISVRGIWCLCGIGNIWQNFSNFQFYNSSSFKYFMNASHPSTTSLYVSSKFPVYHGSAISLGCLE